MAVKVEEGDADRDFREPLQPQGRGRRYPTVDQIYLLSRLQS